MGKFEDAVDKCVSLKGNLKPGLRALGSNSRCVSFDDATKLEGSVDIDKCTKNDYPNDNRWDYAIGYDGEVIFLEIHPAQTNEVSTMIKKTGWLQNFLNTKARDLKNLHKSGVYYWIPSGKMAILSGSPQARRLSQSKIRIKKSIQLK